MKRYISILLLAAFCFLLSGCSSNPPAETEQTEGISETVEVERPEEMPDMCQIGKMEFALPTNCTYYGEAEVEGSETIYLYMGDYQVVVSSDPFPHDISLTDMDEAALELYIGSLSEGSYQIAGCQAAVVGKYPYLLLAYHDEALETVDVVETLKEMPDSLRSFLESINVDVDAIIAEAENAVSDSAAAKDQLIASIAEPISSTVSKAAALIGLALIFFILLFVVMHLLNAVFQMLPFGKSFNRVGGIIFGVIRAILIVMVLGAVIYGLACGNILLSVEELDQTILLKNINKINPILLAFQ